VLVVTNSMSVPICNRFYARQANYGKIKTFRGHSSFTPSFEGNPFTQRHGISSQKIRVLGVAHSEDLVILACTVLIQYSSVTDRRTNGRTDA